MHDPNDASGKPRGGFLGAMAALLLGDDDDDDDDNGDDDKGKDWNLSVFSPLGDAAGAALTRLMHRPARYDGVAEVGRCVADESTSTAVVSTAGKVVRAREPNVAGSSPGRSAGIVKSSREKWGGGLGEVETVMRRASMDVDDDPGSPVGSSRSPFAPPGFDSRADRSGLVFSKNFTPGRRRRDGFVHSGESVPRRAVSTGATRTVEYGDDDSGDADALRVRVLRACVLAMHSADTAGAASGASGDKSHAASCAAAVGVFFAYSLLYGNEGFYRAVVADATRFARW